MASFLFSCVLLLGNSAVSKKCSSSFGNFFFANSGARKFRHGRSIVLSTKLVDGRACWSARRGRVRCTSVDRNAPTALLQFVVDLLENLFLQFSSS